MHNDDSPLRQLAEALLGGRLTMNDFLSKAETNSALPHSIVNGVAGQSLTQQPALEHTIDVGAAQVDLDRQRRCGFPEVVFAPGKTVDAIVKIFSAQLARGIEVFATRVAADSAEAVMRNFAELDFETNYNAVGRTLRIKLRAATLQSSVTATTSGKTPVSYTHLCVGWR